MPRRRMTDRKPVRRPVRRPKSKKTNFKTSNIRLESINTVRNSTPYRKLLKVTTGILQTTTAPQVFAQNFTLNMIDSGQLTAFATLFQQYRVLEYTVSWMPTTNVVAAGVNASPVAMPLLYSVVDFSNSLTLLTQQEFQSYSGVKTTLSSRKHSRRVLPTVLTLGVRNTAITLADMFTAPTRAPKEFIDILYDDLVFYGTKWFLEGSVVPIDAGQFVTQALVEFRGAQ
jgi:hypothetical protein